MSGPRNAHTNEWGSRFYEHRGVKLPSVTSILKIGRPQEWMGFWSAKVVAALAMEGIQEFGGFDAVIHWAATFDAEHAATKTHQDRHKNKCPYDKLTVEEKATRYLKGAPWRKRDAAADAGTERHETFEVLDALAAGEMLPIDAPGREQIEQWQDAYRPEFIESEFQIINLTHGYAGSGDKLVRIYGRTTLLDLKTSRLYTDDGKRKNVDRDWSLQLAAYRNGEYIFRDDERWTMPPIDDCAILWIPSDAPEQWMFLNLPANGDEFAAFLAAKHTHDDHRKYEKAGTPATLILPQALTADEVSLRPVLKLVQGGVR